MLLTYKMNVKPGRSLSIAITFFVLLTCFVSYFSDAHAQVRASSISKHPTLSAPNPRKTDIDVLVRGRVVDSTKQPVQGAIVSLHNLSRQIGTQSVDEIVAEYSTDVDGKFELDSTFARDAEVVLYATTPIPSIAYAPFTPPFRGLDPSVLIRGKSIPLNQKTDLDVGDIPIHAHYHSVTVLLGNSPTVTSAANGDEVSDIWMRLRDARGDIVSLGAVTPNAVSGNRSSIVLSLPEGRWNFDFSFHGADGPWCGIDQSVKIVSSQTDELFVSLKRGRTGDASELLTPQQARDRLARLGISYAETSFVEHAGRCNAEATELFLAAGINPGVKDQKAGNTALLAAAAEGCGEVVVVLLDHGANPNPERDKETSALMAAACSGSLVAVRALLEKQANPNIKDEAGVTALMLAAGNRHLEIVKALVATGADVNSKDHKGLSAFDYAMQSGDQEIIRVLRQVRAKDN